MNARGVAGVVALVLAVSTTGHGAPRPRAAAPPASGSGAVARVGDLRVGHDELDRGEQEAHRLYRERNRADVPPELVQIVRRQVLENLIRQRLLTLESRGRGEPVSDADVEAQIRMDPVFQQGGAFNEAKYLALKASNPEAFVQARARIREALAARRMGERLDRETRPDDAAIRAALERELSLVTFRSLSLSRRSFDGSYREPRESDVLKYYEAQRERYRRPESVRLAMVLFNRPAVADSLAASEAGYRTWEQRMRGRADSALAAIRAGATFEDLALRNGGMKVVVMTRDHPPDLWRGGPREVAAAFAAAPGTLLPEPVHAAPGWALVRVEGTMPSHVAPLKDVSRDIRRDLRLRARGRAEESMMAEIYAAMRDSLRGPGFRVRYAMVDTGSVTVGEPTIQDLDRYYRAHLADYSSYDRASGTIVETPLAQVQGEVRRRWMRERRRELARTAAERLRDTWSRGRRDAALERSFAVLRENEIVPASGDADSGRVAAALSTALMERAALPGVTVHAVEGGSLVLDIQGAVAEVVPTLAQSRLRLVSRLEARKEEIVAAEARRLYEADPGRYRTPAVVHFTRAVVEPPPILTVSLTRAEVERYYRDHLDDYSVEDLCRVRHILIATSGRGAKPDAEARAKAEQVLARVRAGEDFAHLAAQFSDDEATRLEGGDVGVFRRGMMRESFERAAFTMRPGDIIGPVRTDVGYHVMECLEYHPAIFHPLVEVYANVAFDCALRKSKRIATERADSIYRTLRNVTQARTVTRRLGLTIIPSSHEVGRTSQFGDDLLAYIRKVETMKPGQIYPGTQDYEGLGPVITWVDTVLPPRQAGWEEVRSRAIDDVRRGHDLAALLAKRAELDSMAAAGWSFDSLAALWGGAEETKEAEVGSEIRGMGGRALLDSLVFGLRGGSVLEAGRVSDWVEVPAGFVKLQVVERVTPDPGEVARRLEQRRQVVLWRNLKAYFDRLKARHPVQILDGELRNTQLLEPTES